MKKIIIIVGILVIVGMLISIVYMVRTPASTDLGDQSNPTPFPEGNDTQIDIPDKNQSKITVTSNTGQTLEVRNFITDPETIADAVNPGSYSLGNHFETADVASTDTPPYVIRYDVKAKSFSIGLFAEPIKEVRLDAEAQMLRQLGISKEQMCQLNYIVSVPGFVNESYSSRNLGFSFCPGSVTLP
jgi:hypothetical protein